jgi:phenylacetate-coenzyme A ligase PaaK-like adenylate-forming protein
MEKIPILTKKDFMNNWDEIITNSSLKLADMYQLLESKSSNNFPYHITRSGGTSGHTGIYVYDRTAWISSFNSIIRFFMKEEVVQLHKKSSMCRVTLAAPFSNHMTSSLMVYPKDHIKDIYLPVTMPYQSVLEKLTECPPDILQGYPSILSKVAYSQLNGEVNIHPGFIISMAEPLDNSVHSLIKMAWGVKVYDVWASGEFGPLGVTCHYCDNLILNSDHCFFEFDFPTSEISSKEGVLVTGLQNKTMPLIRFQLDDQLLKAKRNLCCNKSFGVIGGVLGRPADMFYYGDIAVHGYCFRMIFLSFPEITNYQLLQTKDGVLVYLSEDYFLREDLVMKLKNMIADAIMKLGVVSPKVEVQYVSEFKKTQAGKIPKLVALRSQ